MRCKHFLIPGLVPPLVAGAASPAVALNFKLYSYRAGAAPNVVATGDFNGNGALDLAIANSCADRDCCSTNADSTGIKTLGGRLPCVPSASENLSLA